jgi:hypothetical protein
MVNIPVYGDYPISSISFSGITTKLKLPTSLSTSVENITISSTNSSGNLISWDIEFVNDVEVGAQINQPITNGFDTSLRIVSNFENATWKSGIWSNGIYKSGVFEGGIWYNGIFEATWG